MKYKKNAIKLVFLIGTVVALWLIILYQDDRAASNTLQESSKISPLYDRGNGASSRKTRGARGENILKLEYASADLVDLTIDELLDFSRRIDPAEFEKYLHLVMESDLDAATIEHMITEASSHMAKTGDFDEIQKIIIKLMGDGRLRRTAIASLYSSKSISLEKLLASMENLTKSGDRDSANMGLVSWARKTDKSKIFKKISSNTSLTLKQKASIVEGLVSRVVYLSSKKLREEEFNDILAKFKSLLTGSEWGDSQMQRFIARSSGVVPFQAFQAWLNNYPDQVPSEYSDGMLRSMNGVSVERTLTVISKAWLGKGKQSNAETEFFRKAIEAGISANANEVAAWYSENRHTLPTTSRDSVSESFAKNMTLSRNYNEARKWVAVLSDPEIKKRSIQGMAQFRSGEIREQTKKSPEATANSLLEESHIESPLLMGVAVNEWLNNKPDDAGKWFFENSKSMNDAQRDSSAEAFVQYGIKVGDLEAARQWADEHSSDEQRRKYYKKIDHAEVEQAYKEK